MHSGASNQGVVGSTGTSSTGLLRRYARLSARFWAEASSARDFARLMQVRLSQSKVGRWVCPEPIEAVVSVESLGGEVKIRSHTTDISVLGELVVSDGYEIVRLLKRQPEVIVDLGANTGLAARWLQNTWPAARLVAVEPEPENVAVLCFNAAERAITVVPAAIGGTERIALLQTGRDADAFALVGEPVGDAVIEVPVLTMPRVLAEAGVEAVDLLKVDIEGSEEELFADCSAWIGRVRALLVECHGAYTVTRLLADLARSGGSFAVLDVDAKPSLGFEVALLEAV